MPWPPLEKEANGGPQTRPGLFGEEITIPCP